VSILTPLVKQPPYTPGVDYSEWHKLMSTTFLAHAKKIKKSRSMPVRRLPAAFWLLKERSLSIRLRPLCADMVSIAGKSVVPFRQHNLSSAVRVICRDAH